MNMTTKRCYALGLKQLRSGILDNKYPLRDLDLKQLRDILFQIHYFTDDYDREYSLNKFWNLVMFESPSNALKKIATQW